jgi:sulfite reductase alpha subunit-like flavoprotein
MTAPSWDQDVRRIVLSLPTRQTNVTANSSSFKDTEVAAETAAAAASLITNNAHIAGDVAVIYPENSPKLVSRLISIIQETDSSLNADTKLSIKCLPGHIKRKSRLGEVKMCTLGRLLSSFLDIGGLPQRGFFEGLALHTSNEEEKEKLTELSSAEGTDLYYDYCVREKRNYIEALEDFRSARPCLAKLLELLPLLQPRHYSIANSGMVCQDEVHLCVAVASSKTPYGRVRVGVCSSYLSSLSPGDQVVLWIRSGSFKMPIKDPVSTGDDQPPLILVGPGTGVAPMRALLQERKAAHKNQEMSGIPQLRTILFFGCRKRESDFLYSDEITNSTQNGNDEETKDPDVFISPSSTVVVAFSRDQAKKVYVTHKIEEHGASVWGLLQQVNA